jgi:CBS domain-containing protein
MTSRRCTANVTCPLTARDIMVAEPITVEPAMTLRQLARVFEENEISGAPVVDTDGRVIGVVSKTDLIRRCSECTLAKPPAYLVEALNEEAAHDEDVIPEALICVEDFMTADPVTVTPDAPATTVARLMHERRIHRIIVVDDEKFPIGIITSLDMLGAYPQPPEPREAPAAPEPPKPPEAPEAPEAPSLRRTGPHHDL